MPATLPTLETERLILRPFSLADAKDVQRLAGDKRLASTTLNVPHPYPDGGAERWIATHVDACASNNAVELAITLRDDTLVGAIRLGIQRVHDRGEMGYWVGVEFWKRGYATEAGKRLLRYGFEDLKLNRIFAEHQVQNPASGRVMQKMGMQHEGRLRQSIKKNGVYYDMERYAILKQDWLEMQRSR